MVANNREIEIKFKIDEIKIIQEKLKIIGAKFLGKTFERTIRFDTPNKDLERKGQFLRIRTGFQNVITFKRKIKNKEFKEREEIEVEISNPEKMKIILENLGFKKILIMEKYRQKWQLKNVEIAIDKLPFGTFIEIEGSKKAIEKTAKILGLNLKTKITSTYWDLWKKFSKEKNIKDENIIFKLTKN